MKLLLAILSLAIMGAQVIKINSKFTQRLKENILGRRMGQSETHLEDEANFDQTKKYGLKLFITLMQFTWPNFFYYAANYRDTMKNLNI